jgi:tetratricopeptide (TPR) repeat protein
VERGIRAPGAPPLDLSRDLLADEIARIRHEAWSGVLALTQGEVTKGVYFIDGEIVFAASTVEEDRLGASLFRGGKITEAQFRAAMKASEGPGQRLGQALVEAGVLTQADVLTAVVAQVERIVVSVLRWTTGTSWRETMERPLPADLALRIDTPRVLLLGLRGFPDVERLERALGGLSPNRKVRRASAALGFGRLGPNAAERAVFALCARAAPLEDLLRLPHPRPQLVRATYALFVTGLIEPAPPEEMAPLPRWEPEDWDEYERYMPGQQGPPGPERAETLARAHMEQGDRAAALSILREALGRNPEAKHLRRLLARTLAREPTFQSSVEHELLTALEEGGGDVELRYALASYYRRAGMATRAILHLKLVLSADSHHAGAWRDLGELEAGEGRRKP